MWRDAGPEADTAAAARRAGGTACVHCAIVTFDTASRVKDGAPARVVARERYGFVGCSPWAGPMFGVYVIGDVPRPPSEKTSTVLPSG